MGHRHCRRQRGTDVDMMFMGAHILVVVSIFCAHAGPRVHACGHTHPLLTPPSPGGWPSPPFC